MKIKDCIEVPESIDFDSNNENLRSAYRKMFQSLPTRYHLTLTFKFGVNERVAVNLLNDFLKYINRAIFKMRYTMEGKSLEGFVVKESTPSMANVHFHIIILDAEGRLPDHTRMSEIIENKIRTANLTVNELNQINKYQLQNYYEGNDNSSLEQYLTKIFERRGLTTIDKMNSICPMGAGRVSFY